MVPTEHGPGIDIFTPGKPGEYDLDGGIWEDEDARNFYENMVDLKAFVPAILFKDNDKGGLGKDKDDGKGTTFMCAIDMHALHTLSFYAYSCKPVFLLNSASDTKEAKEAAALASTTEELELELEALDIADDPLELEGPDETENEELAKKLLDEQGRDEYTPSLTV